MAEQLLAWEALRNEVNRDKAKKKTMGKKREDQLSIKRKSGWLSIHLSVLPYQNGLTSSF